MAQNRNLFRLTRFILLKLPYLFRFLAMFRRGRKRLLIVKPDAIGDYIMFRNFIAVVRQSARYKDYEMDLLGNELWQDLALEYDAAYIRKFYFNRVNQLYHNPSGVLKLGWHLFKQNYEVVLNPSSTRTFITDGLAALVAAKQTIGFESDTEGIEAKYKTKTDRFYTQRLLLPPAISFEFYRHQFFFKEVLGETITIQKPFIPTTPMAKEGVMIFTGAGVQKRGWEIDKFVQLINLLQQHYTGNIYLAGGPAEAADNAYIAKHEAPGKIIDLTGQTTLPALVQKVASCGLVIANDSSAIHMAVAVNTPSVCITGGGHFNRFVPYPADIAGGPVCVYQKMDCYYCNWNCIYQTAAKDRYPCIGVVSVDMVWQAVKTLLPPL